MWGEGMCVVAVLEDQWGQGLKQAKQGLIRVVGGPGHEWTGKGRSEGEVAWVGRDAGIAGCWGGITE